MSDGSVLEQLLEVASVEDSVFELCPDYRSLLVAADGFLPDHGGDASEQLLQAAEANAREILADRPAHELAHVAAWRDAYRAFGAKPQRTRNSLEALLRRVPAGLPRINPLTDLYNAISVLHQVPIGGEDLSRYAGAPRLVRAMGDETFETAAEGESVVEHPEPGEVVWRDEAGVTCRRWNWRQSRRTQLTDDTATALFILDALAPMGDGALTAAADDLVEQLLLFGPDVRVSRRLIAADRSRDEGA